MIHFLFIPLYMKKNEYDEKYNTKTKEKIAIVHITGGINDATSRKVVKSLRQIKQDKDIKAVVFRVDSPGGSVIASETILEECKDMQKPVVCSFGNVAASGGYYVSANADRIFASPTTLTGSIGVFGIKFDATELARSHGVEVDFVSTGSQASAYSIFRPLTKKMKINFERNIEKVYSYFKEIVSQGRNIPLKEVEEIAKGRVWTGEQAREVGLVDEIGGLERAILYAKRKYTTDGFAEVEVWPKQLSLQDRILKLSQTDIEALVSDSSSTLDTDLNLLQLVLNGRINPSTLLTGASLTSGMLLTIDESTAVQLLLKEALEKGRN
jgi:protease-4